MTGSRRLPSGERAAPKLPRHPLAAFLDGAGMGRYLGLFRDEEIRTLEDFPRQPAPAPARRGGPRGRRGVCCAVSSSAIILRE